MTNEVPAAPRCFNCGADARWRDDLTGAHRCHGCVITSGGGRPHVVVATEPDDDQADDDTVADEPATVADEPEAMSVWDRLEAELVNLEAHGCGSAWASCAITEGKQQAMAIEMAIEERATALYLLAVYVHAHETGNRVPPHIESQAKALCKEGGR